MAIEYTGITGHKKRARKSPLYRGADLNCRPQGYESCALTS